MSVKHAIIKRKLEQPPQKVLFRRGSVIHDYGIVARNVERTLSIAKELLVGKVRARKINRSEIAQRFVLRKLESIIRTKGIENAEEKLEKIKAYVEKHKSEKGFMGALEEAVKKSLPKDQAKMVLGVLHQHIIESEFGKGVIYDPHENAVHTKNGVLELGKLDSKSYVEVVTKLKKHGINVKKSYYEMKNKQIVLHAITHGRTPEEIQQIYLKYHREALQKDKAYAEGYVEKIKEEVRKTAQVGGLFYRTAFILHEAPDDDRVDALTHA